MTIERMKISDLVIDAELFPRGTIDDQYVAALAKALRAGASIPPPVVCDSTHKVIDGVHRVGSRKILLGPDGIIDVELRTYADDVERFADMMRLNAKHGRRLTHYDMTRCVAIAERLGMPAESLAAALSLRVEDIGSLRRERMGSLHRPGEPAQPIPLKSGVRHLAGRVLKQKQVAGMGKLGGMSASYHASQLLIFLRSDLIDMANESLVLKLRELADLIGERIGVNN